MIRYFVAALVSTLRVARTKRNQVMMLMTGVKLSGDGLSIFVRSSKGKTKRWQKMKKRGAYYLLLRPSSCSLRCARAKTSTLYYILVFHRHSSPTPFCPKNRPSDLARPWTVVGVMIVEAPSNGMQNLSYQYQVLETGIYRDDTSASFMLRHDMVLRGQICGSLNSSNLPKQGNYATTHYSIFSIDLRIKL